MSELSRQSEREASRRQNVLEQLAMAIREKTSESPATSQPNRGQQVIPEKNESKKRKGSHEGNPKEKSVSKSSKKAKKGTSKAGSNSSKSVPVPAIASPETFPSPDQEQFYNRVTSHLSPLMSLPGSGSSSYGGDAFSFTRPKPLIVGSPQKCGDRPLPNVTANETSSAVLGKQDRLGSIEDDAEGDSDDGSPFGDIGGSTFKMHNPG